MSSKSAQVKAQCDLPVDAKNDKKVKVQGCEELRRKPQKTESTRSSPMTVGLKAKTEGDSSMNEDTKIIGDGNTVDQGGVEAKARDFCWQPQGLVLEDGLSVHELVPRAVLDLPALGAFDCEV